MRFSLKWLLAGMAYVALAAAAVIGALFCPHVLWTVTIGIFLYALLICVASHWGNAFCAGFVVFSAAHLLVFIAAPNWLPSSAGLTAAGYRITNQGVLLQKPTPQSDWHVEDDLMHAVAAAGTMAAGLIGGALATGSYRRHGKRE
jgi:hypothetical protein